MMNYDRIFYLGLTVSAFSVLKEYGKFLQQLMATFDDFLGPNFNQYRL